MGGVRRRMVLWAGAVAGAVLGLIGLRFLLQPEAAQRFFGIGRLAVSHELHAVIGVRDLWLGALAIVGAWLGDVRGLGLWFLLGTGVCLADAGIVARAGGALFPIGLHLGAGVLMAACGVLALSEAGQ
jgi:hypothetical protein